MQIFEGIIPMGQYGGGTVMLWDSGTWEPLVDPTLGLKQGKLTFKLHGEKLQGAWTLLRLAQSKNNKPNWFLVKKEDEYAYHLDDAELLTSKSVKSGLDLDEIAAGRKENLST